MSYDLRFVAPERREEVCRRIQTIERFIATPGRKSAEKAAEELGIRPAQFYNLVRAWREVRRPERLAGSVTRRQRNLAISDEQAKGMDRVIASDPRADPSDIVHAIMKHGLGPDVTLPRQEVVARYVARARPPLLPLAIKNQCEMMIDHTVLDVPVVSGSALMRPLATMIIDTSLDAIVGLSLTLRHPDAAGAAAALLDTLRHSHGTERPGRAPRILRTTDGDGDWNGLDHCLLRASFEIDVKAITPRGGGKAISALLGQQVCGISLRPWLARAPLAKREALPDRSPQPMTLKEATQYIRDLVVSHRTTSHFAHLDGIARRLLDQDLERLSKS